MEAREKSLRDQIRATEEELAAKTNAMHETERTLADKQAELEKLTARTRRAHVSHRQPARRNRCAAHAGRSAARPGRRFETDIRVAEDRLTQRARGSRDGQPELAAERGRAQTLGSRVTELEQQLLVQSNEAQELGRKVLELEARLSEQGKKLAERDYEVIRLRTEVETLRRTEADLRAEMASMEDRHNGTSGRLRSEKTLLENELAHVRDERTNLQQEVATLKREAETSWAAERVENALLRERINDIATEVARLTMVLEGPGSPIETMLSADHVAPKKSPATGPRGLALPKRRSRRNPVPAAWPIAFARCRPAPRASRRRRRNA